MPPEAYAAVLPAVTYWAVALLVVAAFWVGRELGTNKELPGEQHIIERIGRHLLVLGIVGFLAYGTAVTLGTHTENCDDVSCDRVVDFVPTAHEKAKRGWEMFVLLSGPALVGVYVGTRRRRPPPADEPVVEF
jgi:hypothetical protein